MHRLRHLCQRLSDRSYCGSVSEYSPGKGRACLAGCRYIGYVALPFFYFLCFFTFLTLAAGKLEAESSPLLIQQLDRYDLLFRQYTAEVEIARRALFAPGRNNRPLEELPPIYHYITRENDNLMAIAARCLIPIDTLASINRISHPLDLWEGRVLLLPSMPGIFVPDRPISELSELERLLVSSRAEGNPGITVFIPLDGSTETYTFFPGVGFSQMERIFFYNRGFQFPLRDFTVTSEFGPRINPVSGRQGQHRGIDLAAPAGTEVYAVRSGTVIDLGYDSILGNYIMIQHDNNWVSVYGHLSSTNTSLNSEVRTGSFIGRVGSTGQSTGPHLHFELIQNGQHHDPARLLRLFSGE